MLVYFQLRALPCQWEDPGDNEIRMIMLNAQAFTVGVFVRNSSRKNKSIICRELFVTVRETCTRGTVVQRPGLNYISQHSFSAAHNPQAPWN